MNRRCQAGFREDGEGDTIVLLTAYDDRQFVVEAVRAGARGYVLKARDAEHLIPMLGPVKCRFFSMVWTAADKIG